MERNSGALAVPGNLESISNVRNWLAELLVRKDIPDEIVAEIQSAITEICTNVARHGYQDQNPGEIRLEAVLGPDWIKITITDDAPAFVPDPEVQLPRRGAEGGYGLFMVNSLMDEVTHEALGDIGNRITVVKRIAASPDEPDNFPNKF